VPEGAVVFMRGSGASHQRAFFAEAVRCCRLLGRPGLLITPHADDVPPGLPAGVLHRAFAPLGPVFAQAAALVHHGGVGTMAHALAAGLPQVVSPIVGDQYDLGYRMERLGVGAMLTDWPLRAERMAGAVRRLTGSARVRARCAALRARVDPEAGRRLAADAVEAVMAARQVATGRA
jgi:UDP:flavonoid glycosyltransferase YjiC (YdhE family)